MSDSTHDAIRDLMTSRQDELIALHRALVSIPTVNKGDGATADEDKLAALAADYLRAAGIETSIVAGAPGRGNLLAETGHGRRGMLWMSHADVVPAGDEAAWTHPPFSAALVDGRIWGRGANDCKMLVAAQLFAMACLKRLGLPAKGRLKIAIGADEEVGGQLGFGYLAREHGEFLKADLAICEGGGSSLGTWEEDKPVVTVGAGEKGRYEVILRVEGPGGHACTPWKTCNPLETIAELIDRLKAWRPRLTPRAPIFEFISRWSGLGEPITAENVEAAIASIEGRSPALASSLKAQSRMTLTPTMTQAGDKSNAIPTRAKLVCDSRTLPGQPPIQIEEAVAEVCRGLDNVKVTIKETAPPSVSEFNGELSAMFARATERAVGRPVQIVPNWCAGSTDARFVRGLGTPVYGYQLIHPDADPNRLSIHCVNESIEVGMLLPCALSLAHLAAEFLDGK